MKRIMAGKKAPSIPEVEPDLPKWIWCLVANVRDYPVDELFNVIKKERRETKHFAPGARVYVYPVQWGDGWDRMVVVGRKKGTRRVVRKVIPGSMLEDFRLRRVYSPTVISWMCGARFRLVRNRSDAPWGGDEPFMSGWDNTDESRKTIEEMADSWKCHRADPEGYMAAVQSMW